MKHFRTYAYPFILLFGLLGLSACAELPQPAEFRIEFKGSPTLSFTGSYQINEEAPVAVDGQLPTTRSFTALATDKVKADITITSAGVAQVAIFRDDAFFCQSEEKALLGSGMLSLSTECQEEN